MAAILEKDIERMMKNVIESLGIAQQIKEIKESMEEIKETLAEIKESMANPQQEMFEEPAEQMLLPIKEEATSLQFFPPELMVEIFENLNGNHLENSSLVSITWHEIAVHHFYRPHLKRLAKQDEDFKTTLQEEEWTEDSDETDLIRSLYCKYGKYYKARVLVISGYGTNGHEQQKMEIIHLNNPDSKNEVLPDDGTQCSRSVGGLLQGQAVLCGGSKYGARLQSCTIISQTTLND